ncbi:uncharacterized protein LOC120484307 [Tachysurus ichikawai]
MMLRVQSREEQKYIKLSELTFDAFLKEVRLKFNIPESRQPDIKVPHDHHHHARVHLMTVILNFMMCDPVEEEADAEGSQPKRSCHINFEAKTIIDRKKILTSKPGGERIMQEYGKTKSLTDATRRQTYLPLR